MNSLNFHDVDIASYVATVTVNRPPVNAQNRSLREEGTAIFDELGDRDDVRVIILTAAGQYFSAGADIKERQAFERQPGEYTSHNRLTRIVVCSSLRSGRSISRFFSSLSRSGSPMSWGA